MNRLYGIACALVTVFSLVLPWPAWAHVHDGLPPLAAPMDRSTPRRTLEAFVEATQRGDYERAAHVLDLRSIPASERAAQGPKLARQLRVVLDRRLPIDLDTVSDEPRGEGPEGAAAGQLGAIALPRNGDVPVALARVWEDGKTYWLVSGATVKRIPELHDVYGLGFLEELVPELARARYIGPLAWFQWLGLLLALPLSYVLGFGLEKLLQLIAVRITAKTSFTWDDHAVGSLRGPVRLLLMVFVLRGAVRMLRLPVSVDETIVRLLTIAGIVGGAWALLRLVHALSTSIEEKAENEAIQSGVDGYRARGVRTRLSVFRRLAHVLVLAIAASLVLLQFETVRSVGVSLLASAGLAGVVLGFAAQKSVGTLLAGLQLSVTQPIRIGDSVLIENEFGTVEEISLTYVVVKIWDERRLVVPMTRFLDQPFQNWTKVSSRLLGTVILYADYTVPVEAIRRELDAILANHTLWDGRVKKVHVTDATERTVQLRLLVSAANPGDLFELRAEVRERMVSYLRTLDGGRHLPRTRVDEGARRDAPGVAAE